MKKAVIYARQSTNVPEMMESQVSMGRLFVKALGMEVIGVITEVETSDQGVKNPGFKEAQYTCIEGGADALVCASESCITRHADDYKAWVKELEDAGVSVKIVLDRGALLS